MIRMEYPSVNLDDYKTAEEKVYALQSQVESLASNIQIVLDSLNDDGDTVNHKIDEVTSKFTNEGKNLSNHVITDSGDLSAVSVPTGTTLTTLASVTLDKGIYILIGLAGFASNTTGRRGLAWGSQDYSYYGVSLVVEAPASGGNTRLQTILPMAVAEDGYQMNLNCYQTSGSDMNVTSRYRILKLGQGERL